MRSLMAISEKLSTNYAQYLENHDLIPLQININLFSAINLEKVKSSMRNASAGFIYRSCIPLLIMGKTYSIYATRIYQHQTREQTFAHFESAYHCFKTVVNAIATLSPLSLDSKIADERLAANYWLLYIQFNRVEALLHYHPQSDLTPIEKIEELEGIINDSETFYTALEKSFKTKNIKKKLGIEAKDLSRRKEEVVKQATKLLGNLITVDPVTDKTKNSHPLVAEESSPAIKYARIEPPAAAESMQYEAPVELAEKPSGSRKKIILDRFFAPNQQKAMANPSLQQLRDAPKDSPPNGNINF